MIVAVHKAPARWTLSLVGLPCFSKVLPTNALPVNRDRIVLRQGRFETVRLRRSNASHLALMAATVVLDRRLSRPGQAISVSRMSLKGKALLWSSSLYVRKAFVVRRKAAPGTPLVRGTGGVFSAGNVSMASVSHF